MAYIEIDYKCDKCGEEITIHIDEECGLIMRESARTQPDPYEVEQDQNERDRRF